jgi:hypothetical protein
MTVRIALAAVSYLLTSSSVARSQTPHASVAPPAVQHEAHGSVQRITAKGELPVVGVWVVLHRVGKDNAAPIDSIRTDPKGKFVLRYRPTGDSTALYFIASSYAGIAYFTPPLRKVVVSGGDADLLVYDTTSSPIPVGIRGRHVIITAPDTGKGRTVLEVFELSIDTSLTRVAGTPEKPTFESALPDGATNAVASDGDIAAEAVKFVKGKVQVFAPLAPGIKQLSIHYRIPFGKEPVSFPVLAPTAVLEVLVEDTEGNVSGAKLKKMASVNLEGRPFKRFLAQDTPGNEVVSVIAPTNTSRTLSTRMAIVILAIGAAMLAGLAASLMRKGPLVARAHELDGTDPDDIARKIAALDDAFEKKESPTEDERADHYESRAHLKSKLTSAIARRDGL